MPAASGILERLGRAIAGISAGWRAAGEWRRLCARSNGMRGDQVARAVFEHNFA